MAKLPESIPLDNVQGTRPSTATVDVGDLGLNAASRAVEALADKAQRNERVAAEPYLLKLQGENETAFQSEAAAYTGDEPGFAADQISKAQGRAATLLSDPTIPQAVKAQLNRLAPEEVTRIGQQAIAHEAKVRAEPILEQQRAIDLSQANTGLTAFQTAYAPAKQKLVDGFDGSGTTLVGDMTAAFDAASAAAIAATPARQQPVVKAQLAAQRTQEIAEASLTQQKGADAYVLKSSQDQAFALVNTVVSSPAAYENVRIQMAQIVEAMPGAVREGARSELDGMLASARVKGLVDQGDVAQAKTELAEGRYDAVLKPDQKEALVDHVLAAERQHGPKTFDEWMSAEDLSRRADADVYARATTGQGVGDLDAMAAEITQSMGPQQGAEYKTKALAALQQFTAVGAVHDMDLAQLNALASAPAPDPSAPDYPTRVSNWRITTTAAQAEQKALLSDPAAWAMTPGPVKKAAAATAGAQDRAARLQSQWQDVQNAQGAAKNQAAFLFAGGVLNAQSRAGVPLAARLVLPAGEASRLAASVNNAAPEQKLAAMQALGDLVVRFPNHINFADGSSASPRSILARQLQAAHLSPVELSAIVDYGGDPAKLGRVVAAMNDPTLKKPLDHGQQPRLEAAVRGQLGQFLASVRPLPGAQALEQARVDRTVLVARGLMNSQGLSFQAAAQQASQDMTGGYEFVDTWRVPRGVASDASPLRRGAAQLMADLTGKGGANLYAPAGLPGDPANRRAVYAAQIQHSGQWVTNADEGGLTLMVPHPDGSWDPVADRYGRPVRASWDQLKGRAKGAPSPFDQPPPAALIAPDGKPMPAVSRSSAFSAMAWAVNGQESRFHSGLVSPAGALGQMQVMPDTVKTYAPRLGLPVDLDRAQHDDAYNRRIGEAALRDHVDHFGAGAGLGLALASYNAGRGRVEGYRDPKTNTWHPGWLQTYGDPRKPGGPSLTQWVARIPVKETREYVQAVLPSALTRLQGRH